MVNNASENLGNFWYVMHEMFPDRLEFIKMMYLLETATMCTFIAIHLHKTYDMLELHPEVDRKRKSLMLNGVLIISLIKLVMN